MTREIESVAVQRRHKFTGIGKVTLVVGSLKLVAKLIGWRRRQSIGDGKSALLNVIGHSLSWPFSISLSRHRDDLF